MHVQCSRETTGPGGEANVGWQGKRVSDQIGQLLILSRCQSSRLGSTEQHVTDGIRSMTCNPVPVATTANLMVTEGVSDGVAFGAGVGRAVEWRAQPVPQAAVELLVVEEETQGSRWYAITSKLAHAQGCHS